MSRKSQHSLGSLSKRLQDELEGIQKKFRLGVGLIVIWSPNHNTNLSGEVKAGVIYVYDEDETTAVQTLRHEVIDYSVSQSMEPYKQVANGLISILNEEAYTRKEKLVEGLVRMLGSID